jgi:hypothetical protein
MDIQMFKTHFSVISIVLILLLSGCTPGSKELAEALTPPEFSDGRSRLSFSDDGTPIHPEFIITFPLQGSPYTGEVVMEVAFGDTNQRLYYIDENLQRIRMNNPQTACTLGIGNPVRVDEERVYYCAFDHYLNNQLLEAEQVVYRWYGTITLKDGGTDTLEIESGLFLINSVNNNHWDQRVPEVNNSTNDVDEPINASRWKRDPWVEY